jgi:hypothetical protein
MHLCEQINGKDRRRKPATVEYRKRHPQNGWKYICAKCDKRMQEARERAAKERGIYKLMVRTNEK